MRILLPIVLSLLAGACNRTAAPPDIRQIEIRQSGAESLDVIVRPDRGIFLIGEPRPDGRTGTFAISSAQFDALRQRLEPYRRQSAAVADTDLKALVQTNCPKGAPYVIDDDSLYIHWTGPDLEQHYIALFGCDRTGNAARNAELLGILGSLPLPDR